VSARRSVRRRQTVLNCRSGVQSAHRRRSGPAPRPVRGVGRPGCGPAPTSTSVRWAFAFRDYRALFPAFQRYPVPCQAGHGRFPTSTAFGAQAERQLSVRSFRLPEPVNPSCRLHAVRAVEVGLVFGQRRVRRPDSVAADERDHRGYRPSCVSDASRMSRDDPSKPKVEWTRPPHGMTLIA